MHIFAASRETEPNYLARTCEQLVFHRVGYVASLARFSLLSEDEY